MAEKRVSELTAATTVTGPELFVIEQDGAARKVTAEQLRAVFGGGSDNNNENEEETASGGLPAGGTAGQMLVKKSEADYDAEWQDAPKDSVASKAELSGWASGKFTMTVDGVEYPGTVTFDSEGNPNSVTLNGHTMEIILPA